MSIKSADKTKKLKREFQRYKYLAEAKKREADYIREKMISSEKLYEARVEASIVHMKALMVESGEEEIYLSGEKLKAASQLELFGEPYGDHGIKLKLKANHEK